MGRSPHVRVDRNQDIAGPDLAFIPLRLDFRDSHANERTSDAADTVGISSTGTTPVISA
jgi:hypothetical protein